jgi:hypothetical protein
MDLRLRVVGSLPWRLEQQLSVDKNGRAKLLEALRTSELNGLLSTLSLARGTSFELTPVDTTRVGSEDDGRSIRIGGRIE